MNDLKTESLQNYTDNHSIRLPVIDYAQHSSLAFGSLAVWHLAAFPTVNN